MNEHDKSVKCESSQGEEEAEMVERDLAEDAEWKRIQQNTFTRWANEHLKCANSHISDLETDLSDGLRLVALIEVLAGRRLPKHNKKPTFRSQKLENVAVALKFLENQGIRIINIDSSDIVDCKLKLILGLIWTLILHYAISMPMWDGDDGLPDKGATPKQRLMRWIQSKIPDLPISNFTSDWNDGRAVGALVDAVCPGLCPDWQDWDPKDAAQNAAEAMGLADDWLNIPQLIKPEEMVNPNMDEMSMMTYLSQFPNAKLKPGAPIRPRTNPNSVPPPRVRAYGPGIEPSGPIKGAPANFTVETFSAGKGVVDVTVDDPKGVKLPVDIRSNKDRNLTYSVSYTPINEGLHKVKVLFAGRQIPKSPYSVMVEGSAGDPSKVTASGPGLQPDGVVVNRPTYFDIFTKDAGRGVPEVIILDPQGSKTTVPVKLRQTSPDVWRCEYVSPVIGLHSVNVFFAGKLIPKSPMGVRVAPVSDAKKCKAFGRGLLSNGIRVKDDADFIITTKDAGEGVADVRVIAPGGVNLPAKLTKINDDTYECHYFPVKDGRHVVMVTYGGREIPKSPFEVNVAPYKESAIRVFGPGLHGGVVGHPARFTVDTNGENGALGFSIEGPSKAKIECKDNGDGTADVSYLPTAPGPYAIHVLCDNEDIPKSPFIANIVPKGDFDPNKVEVYGPGIQPEGVVTDKPTNFTIDVRKAGQAPLSVSIRDGLGRDVPVKLDDKRDGTIQASYKPTSGSQHVVMVNYGGVAAKDSPFRVKVAAPLNPALVQFSGPGLENPKTNTPTHFNVNCREAGPGELAVDMKTPDNHDLPISLTDNEDGTYTVDYVAPDPGTYSVNLNYGGLKVPKSPLKVKVTPRTDVSKVKVEGLAPSANIYQPQEFTIDSRALGKPKGESENIGCTIKNPSGGVTEKVITPQSNGTYRVNYTPYEEGKHTVDVLYDNIPVPGSPFPVNVQQVTDPSKCRAYGPGLQHGIVNKPNNFIVETRDAGTGGLGLAIEGPSEAVVSCKDNCDGTCSVEYLPTEVGDYDISIKFAEKDIPGSPFKVPVSNAPQKNDSNVTAYGPGLQPQMVREGQPATFTVDSTKTSNAMLDVKVKTDRGNVGKPEIKRIRDGIHEVTYMPSGAGSTVQVDVNYGGKPIKNSPFKVKVEPRQGQPQQVQPKQAQPQQAQPQQVQQPRKGPPQTGPCDPAQVILSGPGISPVTTASLPADFVVDAANAGKGDLDVQVLGPDQAPRKVDIQSLGDGKYKATYLPDDCGRYKINVKYGGKDVPNSPVSVQSVSTGKADACKIKEGVHKTLAQGEEYCITVDKKNAGRGAITCRIRSTSGSEDVGIDIEENTDGTVDVYYSVADAGDYTLNIKFGGQPIPNGLYTFKASEEYRKTTTSHKTRQVKRTIRSTTTTQRSTTKQFSTVHLSSIPVPHVAGAKITSEVKMPSGNVDKPVIEDNRDGTVSIKYEPKEEGTHEVYVKYNGEHVQGSPFKFHVDSLASGHVTAYGPGLIYGVAGEPANFTISTKGAGAGGLSMAVGGPSKAEISCHDNKDGTVSVSYLPTAPGEYKISVKFGDKHIKGSPYQAKITASSK